MFNAINHHWRNIEQCDCVNTNLFRDDFESLWDLYLVKTLAIMSINSSNTVTQCMVSSPYIAHKTIEFLCIFASLNIRKYVWSKVDNIFKCLQPLIRFDVEIVILGWFHLFIIICSFISSPQDFLLQKIIVIITFEHWTNLKHDPNWTD